MLPSLVQCHLLGMASAVVLAGCTASCARTPEAPAAESSSAPLSGAITMDGSSTVFPVARVLAEGFQRVHRDAHVAFTSSSTSDGFSRLCAGQLDFAAASRPINASEIRACRGGQVDFIELPVALDILSVVVNPTNAFVECLTVRELRKMWEPRAEGRVRRWSDIRSGFPEQPFALLGPGKNSGTFDYFTLAVVGTQGGSRGDYRTSDDDSALADSVAANPNALAYFGYAHYHANEHRLKAVAIDGGRGCVTPRPDSAADGTYQPLTRPVFLYASATAIQRAEVAAFARFVLSPEQAPAIQEVGYVPLPTVTLLTIAKHVAMMKTGSIFGGRGAVLGVTADTFSDEERVKSALVR
jgi:phosphate transport system substrate-binding protein